MLRRVAPALLLFLIAPGLLQAQYFGRNKVQYSTFDFKVIQTEHFDVYYYERERVAAMDAARMAERSYAKLSKVLNHEFRERKPIILYANDADFHQTNAISGQIGEGTGGVTEGLKQRVVMPMTGSYKETDHVLGHELVHSFQYDIGLSKEDTIRFALGMPNVGEFHQTPTGQPRTQLAAENECGKARRQRWRALVLIVKAKLEAIESGIATFEAEFLPYTVLPNKQTVDEWLGPKIEYVYEKGIMPPEMPGLLPAPDQKGE